MAYTIQTIISDCSIKNKLSKLNLPSVKMPYNMTLIPLTFDYINKNGIPFLPLTDEGAMSIGEKLTNLCIDCSENCKNTHPIKIEFSNEVWVIHRCKHLLTNQILLKHPKTT